MGICRKKIAATFRARKEKSFLFGKAVETK